MSGQFLWGMLYGWLSLALLLYLRHIGQFNPASVKDWLLLLLVAAVLGLLRIITQLKLR